MYKEKDGWKNSSKNISASWFQQRACETAIDMGSHVVKSRSLGLPQNSRDIFVLLENAHLISNALSKKTQAMIGFRDIAVHNYTKLDVVILQAVLKNELAGLLEFSKAMVKL